MTHEAPPVAEPEIDPDPFYDAVARALFGLLDDADSGHLAIHKPDCLPTDQLSEDDLRCPCRPLFLHIQRLRTPR